MNRWLGELLDTKPTHATVKKYVTVAKTVFAVAAKRDRIAKDPCADFSFVPTEKQRRTRQEEFTKDEFVMILREARKAEKALVRIAFPIGVYSGARLTEIVEAHKKDFEIIDGALVFHVRLDNRPEAQRVKTSFSLRRFPIHPPIVPELQADLAELDDGPLFPEVTVDPYCKLGHNAGEQLRKWLIKLIPDLPKGDKLHMFRHTFKSACRGRIDKEIRNYITG
jgi:integrase